MHESTMKSPLLAKNPQLSGAFPERKTGRRVSEGGEVASYTYDGRLIDREDYFLEIIP